MREDKVTITIPLSTYDQMLRESQAFAILIQYIHDVNKESKYDMGTVDMRYIKSLEEVTYF